MYAQTHANVSSGSCLQLVAKLHGHQRPVWAVRWRPKSSQVVSCGGLSLVLWNRCSSVQDGSVDDAHVSRESKWCLESIIFNEEDNASAPGSGIDPAQPIYQAVPEKSNGGANALGRSVDVVYQSKLDCVNPGIHSRTVRNAAWSRDGRLLAAASFDATASIWEEVPKDKQAQALSLTTQWSCVAKLEGHEHEVKSVAWNPTAELLASCSRDKTVWIHLNALDPPSSPSGTHSLEFACAAVLPGHSQDVKCVAWHPIAELVISASYDNSIRVWGQRKEERTVQQKRKHRNSDDEAEWGCLQTLNGHESTVWEVSFSPDGYSFASCSDDKTVRIWACKKPKQPPSPVTEDNYCMIPPLPEPLVTSTLRDVTEQEEGFRSDGFSCQTPFSVSQICSLWFLVLPGFKPSIPSEATAFPQTKTQERRNSLQTTTAHSHTVKPGQSQTLSSTASVDYKTVALPESGTLLTTQTTPSMTLADDTSKTFFNTMENVDSSLFKPLASTEDISKQNNPDSSLFTSWACSAVLSGYHTRVIYSVAWHPVLDVIATACADNAIRIFTRQLEKTAPAPVSCELASEWVLDLHIPNAHSSDVNSVAWKQEVEENGTWLLASAGDDKAVHIYQYTPPLCYR